MLIANTKYRKMDHLCVDHRCNDTRNVLLISQPLVKLFLLSQLMQNNVDLVKYLFEKSPFD